MRMNSPQMRVSSRCIVPYAILNHEQVNVSYCNLCHLSSTSSFLLKFAGADPGFCQGGPSFRSRKLLT